jgi:RNA polymerase sigma-70 factor (ECF subfamily)
MLFFLPLMIRGDTDGDLVRRFKSGDREAFAEIVLRYQHRVFTLCVRWLGDRGVAEEVAQDVFLSLFKGLVDFRGESSLSTFIFRVAVNHCKNKRLYQYRRAHDRHDSVDANPGNDPDRPPPLQLADEGPGTDRGVHRSEAGQILEQALGRLDDSQRAILLLRDVEDLPYEEIADILALPKGTVKSRLHRARAELARVLSQFVDDDDLF